jgi:phosphopantetheinyl transferase (holo-ACP synthase)
VLDTIAAEWDPLALTTAVWSAKEAVFKWYGAGKVDFRADIQLRSVEEGEDERSLVFGAYFDKTGDSLVVHVRVLDDIILAHTFSAR